MVHCWEDLKSHIQEKHGWGSPEHIATYMEGFRNGTCLLEHGHPGDHIFTPDDEIIVSFEKTS